MAQSFPWYTPYQFAGNKPIYAVDLDGLEEAPYLLVENDLKESFPFFASVSEATEEAINGSWQFVTVDAWKWETWKALGGLAEETILSTSSVEIIETPSVDAIVEQFDEDVIHGDLDSRTKFGTKVVIGILSDKGAGKFLKATKGVSIDVKIDMNTMGALGKKVDISVIRKYQVEASLSNKPGRTHGYNWSLNDAMRRAADPKKSDLQGKFGSKADAAFAVEAARKLEIGERAVIPANQGNTNLLIDENGVSDIPATHIFIEVKPAGNSGTIHAFPVPANYNVTPRKKK